MVSEQSSRFDAVNVAHPEGMTGSFAVISVGDMYPISYKFPLMVAEGPQSAYNVYPRLDIAALLPSEKLA
jgi:hypothetical protein